MDDLQLPTYMFFLFTNHHDDSELIYQNKLIFGTKKEEYRGEIIGSNRKIRDNK